MVRFPWGPLPMGTSPARRRGHTVVTQVIPAGGSVIPRALGKHHCLKNGQSAEFRSGGYLVWEYLAVFLECGAKAKLFG